MKRDEWVFELKSEQLAAAARAKVEHHTGRLEFWQQAQAKVMEEVKAKGLSVEASLAGFDYGSNVSSRATPQIMVDQTYQRQLSEAHTKIIEHRKKVSEFKGWVQVLEANGGRTYPLNADDYLFFFGKQ